MRNRVFTLVELLVAIAILVIIATIAVPNLQGFIASNRQVAEYNKILSGFHYARSESVKRRENIRVDIDSSSGSWVVEILDKNDTVIRVIESKDGKIAADTVTVTFSPLGRLADCENKTLLLLLL
jgi:type IV fimbrial biogenesis protein FimT